MNDSKSYIIKMVYLNCKWIVILPADGGGAERERERMNEWMNDQGLKHGGMVSILVFEKENYVDKCIERMKYITYRNWLGI